MSSAAVGSRRSPHTGARVQAHLADGAGVARERRRVVVARDLGPARTAGGAASPGRRPGAGQPASSQCSSVALRRTRCGACGQSPSKQTVSAVVGSPAATSGPCTRRARRSRPWPRNACRASSPPLPIPVRPRCPPCRGAPRRAPARPRDVEDPEQLPSGVVDCTWPPASTPCAITASAPCGTRLAGTGGRPDLHRHMRPRRVAARNALAAGLPPREVSTGTAAASSASSCASGSNESTRLAANGRAERSRTLATSACDLAGGVQVHASVPSAPVSPAAATSAGLEQVPMGACTSARSMPRTSRRSRAAARLTQEVVAAAAGAACERGARFEPRA